MIRQAAAGKADRRSIARFLATGLLNTAFGYTVYAILVYSGLSYLAALLAATVAGIVFNYFSLGRLVFRQQGGVKTFFKFVAAYAATYGVNAAALHTLTTRLNLGPYLAQMLCIPLSVILGWILMNHWVYKNERFP